MKPFQLTCAWVAAFLLSISFTQAGTLSASFTNVAAGANVNLTAGGTFDWAHWGLNNASSFNHKAAVTQQISNFTLIGAGIVQQYSTNLYTFSWTDGTPTASVA